MCHVSDQCGAVWCGVVRCAACGAMCSGVMPCVAVFVRRTFTCVCVKYVCIWDVSCMTCAYGSWVIHI